MQNLKEELLNLIDREVNSEIQSAELKYAPFTYPERTEPKYFTLYPDYTDEELEEFLNSLDFEYHDGHGTQAVYGNVWFKDGTWAIRGEYDGAEWFEHVTRPEEPSRTE